MLVAKKGPKLSPLQRNPSGLSLFLTPISVGSLTAATFAAAPWLVPMPCRLLGSEAGWVGTDEILPRACASLIGFVLGFGSVKLSVWLRWRTLKALLSYHGWIYNQKSFKTRVC